jgi:hypothetical protein
MAHDVFVSYSKEDKPVADAVVAGLENKGIRCWVAPRDITPGSSWGDAIISAIEGSRFMVVILSGSSNRSKQVVREVERAVANNVIIIPFRIEDMQPFGAMAYYLSSEYWMDAITPPLDKHILHLINTILGLRGEKDESVNKQEELGEQKANIGLGKRLSEINGIRKKENPREALNSIQNIEDKREGQLKVIDTIEVKSATSHGSIRLCFGDLTNASVKDNVDVLIIWSVKDDYSLISGSLIKALDQKGVSIEALAMDKEVDLRQAFSCWLSREIKNLNSGISFKRILCYEPDDSAKAAELVGDIFRSLAPFLGGSFPIRTVSTPLLASGRLMKNKKVMLRQLVEVAVHWMSSGLPLDCLNIVCLPDSRLDELTQLFTELKSRYASVSPQRQDQFSYDFFISYSHKDTREVDLFVDLLLAQNQDLRIFIDKKSLNPGSAWQREIYEAIDDCRKVATFFSPTYLDSKVCLEEFNIALCRHRESEEPILKPIYLYSANLPTYMRLIQFFDCRESNRDKLKQAATHLLQSLH